MRLTFTLAAVALVLSAPLASQAGVRAYGIDVSGGGSDIQINNTTEAEAIFQAVGDQLGLGGGATGLVNALGNTYNITTNASEIASQTDWAGTGGGDFPGGLPYPGGIGGDDFLVATSFNLWLDPGTYTVGVESDDGFTLTLDGITFSSKFGGGAGQGAANELRFEAPTGNSNTSGEFTVDGNGVDVRVSGLFWERGGGDFWEISIIDSLAGNPGNKNAAGFVILQDGAVLANGTQIGVFVPEPTSASLLAGLGLLGVSFGRRRR